MVLMHQLLLWKSFLVCNGRELGIRHYGTCLSNKINPFSVLMYMLTFKHCTRPSALAFTEETSLPDPRFFRFLCWRVAAARAQSWCFFAPLAALGNSTVCTVFVAKNVAKIMVLRCLEYQKGWEILGNSIRIALQGHLWQAEAGITRIRSQRNLDRKGRRLIGRLMNFPKKNRYEIHLEICDFWSCHNWSCLSGTGESCDLWTYLHRSWLVVWNIFLYSIIYGIMKPPTS